MSHCVAIALCFTITPLFYRVESPYYTWLYGGSGGGAGAGGWCKWEHKYTKTTRTYKIKPKHLNKHWLKTMPCICLFAYVYVWHYVFIYIKLNNKNNEKKALRAVTKVLKLNKKNNNYFAEMKYSERRRANL